MTRLLLAAVAGLFAVPFVTAAPPSPATIAKQIDARIDAKLKDVGVKPAAVASDAEFLRRVTLDIIGRIPTVAEARSFLDDNAADKRVKLVESLLASPPAVNHSAAVWRLALMPQAALNQRLQHLNLSLEAWLRDRLRAGRKADELVRELLTAPLDYLDRDDTGKQKPKPGPSAVAFYQANDLKTETTTATAARVLLGIKIECAQCHDHPFDKWTQQQFWETAAFFAGVPPQAHDEKPQPIAKLLRRDTVTVGETKDEAKPKFLDGNAPKMDGVTDTRQPFAEWATSRTNPFFAKATANRIWAQFFGVGLVDPVDDFHLANPPSHPELQDELAAALIAADFDTTVLVKAITRTATYQRSSVASDKGQNDPRLFARMNVKGLSPEQLFDSLAQATGYREEVPAAARFAFGVPADSPRGQFLNKFAGGARRTDAQTSILQALTLMNGAWLARQTDPAKGETLVAIADAPFLNDASKIETLFLTAYARKPTADELKRFTAHLAGGKNPKAQLADILWSLLNSQEFLLNH